MKKKINKKFGGMVVEKKPMIFKLQTKNWNKLTPKEQDKALLWMFRVLVELSEHRKYGYDDEFFAQYP
jgi:hypothetical protein